ncbi:MAG: hypothetical protein HY535_01970 [Chloroflexi bacterium]|nr:hypothetical protein [Chloroflexota bacterium]
MRRALFLLTLLTGLILAFLGFFLAAPVGPTSGPQISSPRVQFAPGIFVIGVALMFASAVVYELVPNGRGDSRSSGKGRP